MNPTDTERKRKKDVDEDSGRSVKRQKQDHSPPEEVEVGTEVCTHALGWVERLTVTNNCNRPKPLLSPPRP